MQELQLGFIFSCILLTCSLTGGTRPVMAQDDRFHLILESPRVENGGVVQGQEGETITLDFRLSLVTDAINVSGVVVPLSGSGAEVEFHPVDCDVDCANDLYFGGPADRGDEIFFYSASVVDPVFENVEGPLAFQGPQGPGVVVGLSTDLASGFAYPRGKHGILDFSIDVVVPAGGIRDRVTLDALDGLRGQTGRPQSLTISRQGVSLEPRFESFSFGVEKDPRDPRFIVRVESDQVSSGGVITGVAGSTVLVDARVTLETLVEGAAGVVVPLSGRGPGLTFRPIDCDSTCANERYFGNPGDAGNEIFFYNVDVVDPAFENVEGPLAGAGTQGPGVIVGLSTNVITGYSYPVGIHGVLDFQVEVTIPGGGESEMVVLSARDGLKGTGVPQRLTVSLDAVSLSPIFEELRFQVREAPPELHLSLDAEGSVEGPSSVPELVIPASVGEKATGSVFVLLDSALDQDEGVIGFQLSIAHDEGVNVLSTCLADELFERFPQLGGEVCPESLQFSPTVDPAAVFENEDPECELEIGQPQGPGISGGALLSGIPPLAGEFLPGNTGGPVRLVEIQLEQAEAFTEDGVGETVSFFDWRNCLRGSGSSAKTKLTVQGESLRPLSRTGMSVRFVRVTSAEFIRGDSNGDLRVDLSDALHLIDYQFLGGEAPGCPDAADTNDDEKLDIADVVQLITALFRDVRPLEPSTCGTDDDTSSESCPPGSTPCP